MENFRPSRDLTVSVNANANFVSNAISQTTMVDHNRLVNVSASCKLAGVPNLATLDGSKMDKPEMTDNEESVAQRLEASLSPDSKQKIESLLADIRKLDDKQKLLLYLQLPSGSPEQDVPSKSSSPMLSSCRVDQMTAVNWVRSHIEESPDTSLPKQEVYEEYRSFCENSCHRPLSTADFGKIIKNVFPAVQARRLGTRGNSRYCYSGMRKKLELMSPSLAPLDAPIIKHGVECLQTTCPGCPKSLLQGEDDHLQKAAAQVICEWASGVTNKTFANNLQLAQHLTNNKLVTKSSKSILIVQKHMGEVPRPDLTPEMRHRETNYQLKQTLQYRQEIRKKQAEENQQRLHSSPVSSKQSVTEDNLSSQVTRTDKATQLEQRDVPALSDGSVGNSLTLPESGESSTNLENHLSSSNASSGEGANVASKESPSKRRFAPIQPKTPVRDTGAPMVLISPSAKNVNGQPMQLVVMNGQKVIPVQGMSKLTSPQQMNVILQPGQNVFQGPVQSVTAMGNQTPVNVVSSPVVGNTVLNSPVIPANSIQNAIKSGHYVLVGNTVKQMRSGLQTVANTNAAIRQNQGQPITTNQVAVVAQAAPPPPHVVVSTSSVACQKTGLSSQGITYNTGTSNVRSQNVTPVFFDKTAPASAPTLTSPVNVMTQVLSSQASPANIFVRNATSALVPIPLSQSIATSESSMLKTSVTFATQPMKLPSSVDVIGSDAFQGNHILSNASQSSVDPNRTASSHLSLINSTLNSNKLEKGTPVGRPVKNGIAGQSDVGRCVAGSSKASIMQNSGSKTVATLLKNAQATSSLASSSVALPKLPAPSTAAVDPSKNLVLAHVQNLSRQQDGNKVQHYVIQAAAEDGGNSALSGERSALTTAVGGIGPVIVNSQELSSLQQGSILTSILTDQQQASKGGLALQTIPVEDANVLNQLVTQPSVSLLTDADHSNNTMLMVSGMSAATMLPHKSKSLDTQLISQLPQTQTAVAIRSNQHQQADVTLSLPLKQGTKMQQLTHIPTSQPRMLERLLVSDNLSYISTPLQNEIRSARSVPTTPIAELQSPPPHMMMRAQSAAIPVQQGGDSVPPSPVDGKSFAFTPINTIEVEGGESPFKPKHKPKPTHPTVKSTLTQALTSNDAQELSQNGNILAKNKGKRSQPSEFLTPNRKRRLSSNSKRVAAASPSAVQFQNQVHIRQNVISPAPNQLTKQQPRLYIQASQQGVTQGSAVGTGNLQIPSQFLGGGLQNQQATLLRRRNPSGPASSTVNMQISGDSETELLNLLNNINPNLQVMLDKKALQNRSQSVPLPEQPANRFSRFQLPTQPEVLTNQNPVVSSQITTSQMQIVPIQIEDSIRQINPTNGFAAKRNLTQDLMNLDVTEEDFAPETLLNTEINSGSNLQPSHSLGETNWSGDQVETSVATNSIVQSQLVEFNMKYDEIADQQNGNSSHLTTNQTLLPNQAFNDTSNSTASSISDGMMIEEFPDKMFQDMEDQNFDLPPTPWQMGTSSTSLSTLECGM